MSEEEDEERGESDPKYELWIRANLGVDIFLKDAILHYLHNKNEDETYKGLPEDEEELHSLMKKLKREKEQHLSRFIKKNQWDILCPTKTNRSNSSKWDVTLMCAVIMNLPNHFIPPKSGWKSMPNPRDASKPAFLLRGRKVRNEVKHSSIDDFSTNSYVDEIWKTIEDILNRLVGPHSVSQLRSFKTESLEKFGVQATSLVTKREKDLKEESKKLSKEEYAVKQNELEELKDVAQELKKKAFEMVEGMKDSIVDGICLLHCNSTSLQAPSFSVKCSGDIENYTKWPLIYRVCDIKHGCINVPFRSVLPGTREGFAIHKMAYSLYGCWTKSTFAIGATGSYLHLMIYQPYNHNKLQNCLSFKISETLTVDFNDMWHPPKGCTRNGITKNTSPVFVYNSDICVHGSIATGPKSTINIKIKPLRCKDLLSNIITFPEHYLHIFADTYDMYLQCKYFNENMDGKKDKKKKSSEESTSKKETNSDGVILVGIKNCTSLRSASISSLHMKSAPVSCVGSIENLSKWHLICKGCDVINGYTNYSFQDIESGSREVFASHSKQYFGYGSCIKATYSIENNGYFLHLMYSLPQFFEFHTNRLALLISKKKHGEISTNQMHLSSFQSASNYYSQILPVVTAEHGICVIGSMGTSHVTEVTINVYPLLFKNLSKSIKEKAKKRGVTKEIYDNFLNSLQEQF